MTSDEKVTGDGSGRGRAAVLQTRIRVAQVVRLVFVLAAVVLAVGALLIALRTNINESNAIVKFVIDVADAIDGPFSRNDGIFTFSGKNGATKEALVNWGIAAIVYLVIGRVLDRVIRP
ncbi:MAG: hypothetical protein JWO46_1884 [Nocardioidaceae bacterium]|nr:hypothetical protein [Nocardioidaceae bacterium]